MTTSGIGGRPLSFLVLLHGLGALIACAGPEAPPPDGTPFGQCPDLTGTWRSAEYVALTVEADGDHSELLGLTTTFEVTEQTGCLFSATNTWSNGADGGTEHAAGVLNPDGNWVTIIEVGEHPAGGTTGRILGRLVNDHEMTFEYMAYAGDDSRANVFSTIIAREGSPVPGETCPDMLGTWSGRPFDVLNVYADGSTDQQTGTSNVLTVEHQLGCTFRGVNSWMRGELGGSEHVAGVLHADGVLLSILEVGPHPEQGTRAFTQAHLDGDNMTWDYVGISDDATKGQAFTNSLARQAEPVARQPCPDLTGRWAVDEWNGLRVHADGTHDPITSDFHDFEIREQIGCTLMGVSTYSPVAGETGDWTESWVGVINAEQGVLVMRSVARPSDRLASMLFARIASTTVLHAEYSGYAADGSAALVYLQRLVRE